MQIWPGDLDWFASAMVIQEVYTPVQGVILLMEVRNSEKCAQVRGSANLRTKNQISIISRKSLTESTVCDMTFPVV